MYRLLTVKWEIILVIFFKNLDSENHFEQSFQQSFWFIFQLVRNVRNTHWSKIALRHTPRPFIRHINRYFATHNRISLQWFIIVRFHSENARVRRILAPGHFPGLRHPKSHPPRSQLSYGFDGQTNRGIFWNQPSYLGVFSVRELSYRLSRLIWLTCPFFWTQLGLSIAWALNAAPLTK